MPAETAAGRRSFLTPAIVKNENLTRFPGHLQNLIMTKEILVETSFSTIADARTIVYYYHYDESEYPFSFHLCVVMWSLSK